jgi:hypothetical protein
LASIAQLRWLVERNRHGFRWRLRQCQAAGRRHIFDQRDQSRQHVCAAKGVSAPAPDFRYRVADQMAVQRSVVLDRGGDAEGLGHNGLEFQDIGDVVNKACG